jgi:hypothetical protein
MPPNSRNSINDSFFDKHLKKDYIYNELTLENLKEVYKIALQDAEEEWNTLIIFDDVQKYLKGECESFLLDMASNRRHSRLSMWFACQTYKSIPAQIRLVITDLFVFKISKHEMENIFIEQIEQHKDMFMEILKLVFKDNHDFMFINTSSQRIFSNWDELLLKSDESSILNK